jgi:thioredoxin 1
MAEITHTTDADFQKEVSEPDKLVVVDLWAEWCGPCRMMEPILEELAEEYDTLKIAKLNIDRNQETPLKYGVMNIPTLLFFKAGQEVDRIIGVYPKKQLKKKIEEHLA